MLASQITPLLMRNVMELIYINISLDLKSHGMSHYPKTIYYILETKRNNGLACAWTSGRTGRLDARAGSPFRASFHVPHMGPTLPQTSPALTRLKMATENSPSGIASPSLSPWGPKFFVPVPAKGHEGDFSLSPSPSLSSFRDLIPVGIPVPVVESMYSQIAFSGIQIDRLQKFTN
jgi:hypothetical protein